MGTSFSAENGSVSSPRWKNNPLEKRTVRTTKRPLSSNKDVSQVLISCFYSNYSERQSNIEQNFSSSFWVCTADFAIGLARSPWWVRCLLHNPAYNVVLSFWAQYSVSPSLYVPPIRIESKQGLKIPLFPMPGSVCHDRRNVLIRKENNFFPFRRTAERKKDGFTLIFCRL